MIAGPSRRRQARTKAVVSPFTVAIDPREQLPFSFSGLTTTAGRGHVPIRVQTARCTLAAGDYGIVELPGVAIARMSLGDLYSSLGAGRQEFVHELDRLAELEWSAVVIEASWQQIATEPPERSRTHPRSVVGSVLAFMQRYPTTWITAGNRRFAEAITYRLLERFWNDRQNGGLQ